MYKLYLVKDTIKKMLMYIDAECLISFKILWHALSNICLGPRGVEKAVKIQRTKLPITIRCMISQHLRNGAPRWPWPLTHGRKTGIKRESSDRSIKGTCRILHVGYFLSTQGYFSFKNSINKSSAHESIPDWLESPHPSVPCLEIALILLMAFMSWLWCYQFGSL